MNKLNQKGIAHLFILVVLVLGLFAVLYLVSNRTNWLPKASVSGPVTQATTFQLSPNTSTAKVGDIVTVKLNVRSDVSAVNLFNAKILFSKDLFVIDHIDYANSIVKNWVEQYSDNATGVISLVGGIPNPGFQTTLDSAYSLYAVIYLKTVKAGTATIAINDGSAIYTNADNINILTNKDSIAFDITQTEATPVPSPSSPTPSATPVNPIQVNAASVDTSLGIGNSAAIFQITAYNGVTSGVQTYPVASTQNIKVDTRLVSSISGKMVFNVILSTLNALSAGTYTGTIVVTDGTGKAAFNIPLTLKAVATVVTSPAPSATPAPGTGDGNKDGKVDLIDLSVLLTDYNKNQGFRTSIDMNGDGIINAFDFGLLRNLLIQKGVIKG